MPERLTNKVEPGFTLSSGRPHILCFLFKGLIMGGGNKGTLSLFNVLNSVRGRKEVKGGSPLPTVHLRLVLKFFFFFYLESGAVSPLSVLHEDWLPCRNIGPGQRSPHLWAARSPHADGGRSPNCFYFWTKWLQLQAHLWRQQYAYIRQMAGESRTLRASDHPHPALQEASAWASSTVVQPNQISHLGFLLVSRAF